MGVITAVNGGIAGVDALAGGYLAGHFGFSSVFWVMALIALIAAGCVLVMTDETSIDTPVPMDWLGTLLLVIAVGTALVAINEAAKLAAAKWVLVVILAVVCVLSALTFWRREGATAHPLVTTTYLKARSTWALLTTTLLTMTGVFAIMNGIIPALAQDGEVGAGMAAEVVSLYTLTPYAIAGLAMGPVAGTLAGRIGYHKVLRIGLAGTIIGLILTIFSVYHPTPAFLLIISIFVGITYAGIGNIMLNGLGIELSPADNPGYLPGLNAGAFNLGAGMSFAVLCAINTAAGMGQHGYVVTTVAGAILLCAAFAFSLLIPKHAPQQ